MARSVRQNEDSPTLTYNTIGRHISKMVYTKVVSQQVSVAAQEQNLAVPTAIRLLMVRDALWQTRSG